MNALPHLNPRGRNLQVGERISCDMDNLRVTSVRPTITELSNFVLPYGVTRDPGVVGAGCPEP